SHAGGRALCSAAKHSDAVGGVVVNQRLGAVFLDDIGNLIADFLEGLIPGNLFPFSAAALARPLHRVQHSVGSVHRARMLIALLASARIVVGHLRFGVVELRVGARDFLANHLAVLGIDSEGTTAGVAVDPMSSPLAAIPFKILALLLHGIPFRRGALGLVRSVCHFHGLRDYAWRFAFSKSMLVCRSDCEGAQFHRVYSK